MHLMITFAQPDTELLDKANFMRNNIYLMKERKKGQGFIITSGAPVGRQLTTRVPTVCVYVKEMILLIH